MLYLGILPRPDEGDQTNGQLKKYAFLNQPKPTILQGPCKFYIGFHIRNLQKSGTWLVQVYLGCPELRKSACRSGAAQRAQEFQLPYYGYVVNYVVSELWYWFKFLKQQPRIRNMRSMFLGTPMYFKVCSLATSSCCALRLGAVWSSPWLVPFFGYVIDPPM